MYPNQNGHILTLWESITDMVITLEKEDTEQQDRMKQCFL